MELKVISNGRSFIEILKLVIFYEGFKLMVFYGDFETHDYGGS